MEISLHDFLACCVIGADGRSIVALSAYSMLLCGRISPSSWQDRSKEFACILFVSSFIAYSGRLLQRQFDGVGRVIGGGRTRIDAPFVVRHQDVFDCDGRTISLADLFDSKAISRVRRHKLVTILLLHIGP